MKTWQQAADKWLDETKHKRDRRNDEAKLRWIHDYWSAKSLIEIDREAIRDLVKIKATTCKPSTVNRSWP